MARSSDSTTNILRTHEPSIGELASELDGTKDLILARIDALKTVMEERDRLYKERYEAQEKAISKATIAQDQYNVSHNDLVRKMEIQAKETMPRLEIQGMFRATDDKLSGAVHGLEERITGIQNMLVGFGGAAQGGKAVKDESRANIAMAVSVVGLLITIVVLLLRK